MANYDASFTQEIPKGSTAYTQAALIIAENYQYLLYTTVAALCNHYLRQILKYI